MQQAVLLAQLLALLAVANGTPVIAAKLLGKDNALPLDGNAILSDGKPLFGSSKTIRGVALSVALTTIVAPLIGLAWEVGFVVAAGAMIGDLISSFVKRRLGMSSEQQIHGTGPDPRGFDSSTRLHGASSADAAFCRDWHACFFVGALVLSRVFFKLNIRDRPY